MSNLDIRFYYDAVKYLKNCDIDLYKKIKKINSLKKEKYSDKIKYVDNKNNKMYYLHMTSKYFNLLEVDSQNKFTSIIFSLGLNSSNEYIIAIPNSDIPYSTIHSLYKLYDSSYTENIHVDGGISGLFEYFNIQPTSRNLSSDIEKQIVSLYMIYKSSYPILMLCIENEFKHMDDEIFTYLMMKGSS